MSFGIIIQAVIERSTDKTIWENTKNVFPYSWVARHVITFFCPKL